MCVCVCVCVCLRDTDYIFFYLPPENRHSYDVVTAESTKSVNVTG